MLLTTVNDLLIGHCANLINRLPYIQNSEATLLTHTWPWHHITPILQQLRWLPVQSLIQFKILLLVFKASHTNPPALYIPLMHSTPPPHTFVPWAGHDRAFNTAGPKLWNSLPLTLCLCWAWSTNLVLSLGWLGLARARILDPGLCPLTMASYFLLFLPCWGFSGYFPESMQG